MMMLAKLKAVALATVTALALSTGLGMGLMPAAAGDNPTTGLASGVPAKPGVPDKQPAKAKEPPADPKADDATFLRRLTLDLRGDLPTPTEMWFFTSDKDEDKRAKVVEWLVADDEVKLIVAKKLGVAPERLKVVRARLAGGKSVLLVTDWAESKATLRDVALAFTPDGKQLVARDALKLADLDRLVTNKLAADRLAVWVDAGDPKPRNRKVTVWQLDAQKAAGEKAGVWTVAEDGWHQLNFTVTVADTDAEFLKRVLKDVRGGEPTALELKYFTEDRDPKKREKLLDTLLKDPAVQKRLGDEWKKKMLSAQSPTFRHTELMLGGLYSLQSGGSMRLVKPVVQSDKFEKLVAELIAAKKSDAAILESLTLATLGRLPTDSEKKLTLASIGSAKDRKSAWVAVAKALAGEVKEAKFLDVEIERPAKP